MSEKEIIDALLKELQRPEESSTKRHYGISLIKDRPSMSELIGLGHNAKRLTESTAWTVAMFTMQERLMLSLLNASDAEVDHLRAQMRNFQQFQNEMTEIMNRAESLEAETMSDQEKTIARRTQEIQVEEEWNK